MDSRKCQTLTVSPAKPGDYSFYLFILCCLFAFSFGGPGGI